LLSDNNNNFDNSAMKWKCPAKETVSSRLRREMNAGKGVSHNNIIT